MTQQYFQPLLSGFLWGLSSSLLLIIAALVAARDTTVMTTATPVTNTDYVVTMEQHGLHSAK
jgi:hypothetical protein